MMSIRAVDETQPIPRDIAMTVTCDGDHGLFGPPSASFHWHPEKTLDLLASAAGWSVAGERQLCPGCTGKAVRG